MALADRMFGRPQKAHVEAAANAVQRDLGREFTQQEVNHLEAVTDREWRTLLHIPSSKGRYMPQTPWGPRRVEGPKQRQRIRKALVREVADHGLEVAKGRKSPLIAEANRNELDC